MNSHPEHLAYGGSQPAADNRGALVQARLPLSPEQIRTIRFSQPRRGRHGYSRDEVDTFLTRIADDVAGWISENMTLRAEVDRLKYWYRDQGVDPDHRSAGTVSVEGVNLLARAQQHADLVLADAHSQARVVVGDAHQQAQTIIEAARTEADQAAHTYRSVAGADYSAEQERVQRHAAWLRTVLAVLTSLQAQLPALQEQVAAIRTAFHHELSQLPQPHQQPHQSNGARPEPSWEQR